MTDEPPFGMFSGHQQVRRPQLSRGFFPPLSLRRSEIPAPHSQGLQGWRSRLRTFTEKVKRQQVPVYVLQAQLFTFTEHQRGHRSGRVSTESQFHSSPVKQKCVCVGGQHTFLWWLLRNPPGLLNPCLQFKAEN